MVGGERSKPVDGEVADPDEEDGSINWEDPEHKVEDGVGVVVKVLVRSGMLLRRRN